MVTAVPTIATLFPLLLLLCSLSVHHALEVQSSDTDNENVVGNDLIPHCQDCYDEVQDNADQDAEFLNRTSITQEPVGGWGRKRPHGVDVLVATFFLIAAGWLFMAIIYSIIILIILRLQSRGELDIYDENFGRLFCCNDRFSINFSFILRRYAIQLEQEQQRRALAGIAGGNISEADVTRRVRIMTRDERRLAIETLLLVPSEKAVKVVEHREEKPCPTLSSTSTDRDSNTSTEGPLCSICLGEYGEFGVWRSLEIVC